MSRKNRARVIVLVAIMILAAVLYAVWTASSAHADGPPSPDPTVTTDDPCFRQDPECYDTTQEQLPEEVIGRLVDCPDGQVGRIVDVQGTVVCPGEVISPTESASPTQTPVSNASNSSPNTNEVDIFGFGALLGAGLVLVVGSTLYFVFKKDPNLEEARHS